MRGMRLSRHALRRRRRVCSRPAFQWRTPATTSCTRTTTASRNDLLTAGLGKTGLGSAVPPGFADPLHPTAEELRRLAIYNNYRALDRPDAGRRLRHALRPERRRRTARSTAGEGKIAGDEYIAYEDDGGGRNATSR